MFDVGVRLAYDRDDVVCLVLLDDVDGGDGDVE